MQRLILAIAFLPALSLAAWAQTDAHPVVDTLISQLLPYLATAIGLLITTITGLAVAWLKQKWNIEINASQAATLNQALTNAAGGLIQRLGPEAAMKLRPHDPSVQAYAERVSTGLATAIQQLGVDPATIGQRVLEKVPQVLPVGDAPIAVAIAPQGEPGPAGPKGATGAPGKPGS